MGDSSLLEMSWRTALLLAVTFPVMLSGLMLLWHPHERLAARFLGLFLLASVIEVIPQIIGFAGFYAVWPGLTFAPFNVELLLGPLLLIHALYLMKQQLPKQTLWLLIPGLIQFLYYLWAFLMLGDYRQKWAYNDRFHEPYVVPVESVIGVALFIYCWVRIFWLFRAYEQHLEHHESAALDFRPGWLQHLLVVTLLLLIFFAVAQLVPVFITKVSYVEEFPLVVLMMVLLAWIGFEALRKLNQPFPKMSDPSNQPPAKPEQRSWLTEAEQLQQQMEQHHWYLEPKLSLRDLAGLLHSNESYVSRTINSGLGMSFNQYINRCRIQHAKQLLMEQHQSVLNIALDSGFNSKATFNRVFKQAEGLTPSQYKNHHKKSQIT